MTKRKKTKSDYFVFDGEMATYGRCHEKIGNHNQLGTTYKFKSKAAAVKFYNDLDSGPIQAVGTMRAMRKYHLGCSVAGFEEGLRRLMYES